MKNRTGLSVLTFAAAAFAATAASAEPTYVLGENLFLSPGVAQLARADGKVNLGRDPRIVCQPQHNAAGPVTICYTRAEVEAQWNRLIGQGRYLPGTHIVVSKGVNALIAQEGSVDVLHNPQVECDVIKPTGTHFKVNYCRTKEEARLEHQHAVEFLRYVGARS